MLICSLWGTRRHTSSPWRWPVLKVTRCASENRARQARGGNSSDKHLLACRLDKRRRNWDSPTHCCDASKRRASIPRLSCSSLFDAFQVEFFSSSSSSSSSFQCRVMLGSFLSRGLAPVTPCCCVDVVSADLWHERWGLLARVFAIVNDSNFTQPSFTYQFFSCLFSFSFLQLNAVHYFHLWIKLRA